MHRYGSFHCIFNAKMEKGESIVREVTLQRPHFPQPSAPQQNLVASDAQIPQHIAGIIAEQATTQRLVLLPRHLHPQLRMRILGHQTIDLPQNYLDLEPNPVDVIHAVEEGSFLRGGLGSAGMLLRWLHQMELSTFQLLYLAEHLVDYFLLGVVLFARLSCYFGAGFRGLGFCVIGKGSERLLDFLELCRQLLEHPPLGHTLLERVMPGPCFLLGQLRPTEAPQRLRRADLKLLQMTAFLLDAEQVADIFAVVLLEEAVAGA